MLLILLWCRISFNIHYGPVTLHNIAVQNVSYNATRASLSIIWTRDLPLQPCQRLFPPFSLSQCFLADFILRFDFRIDCLYSAILFKQIFNIIYNLSLIIWNIFTNVNKSISSDFAESLCNEEPLTLHYCKQQDILENMEINGICVYDFTKKIIMCWFGFFA